MLTVHTSSYVLLFNIRNNTKNQIGSRKVIMINEKARSTYLQDFVGRYYWNLIIYGFHSYKKSSGQTLFSKLWAICKDGEIVKELLAIIMHIVNQFIFHL